MRKLAPSHRNQTGLGWGVPSSASAVTQMTISSRSRRATCAPKGVDGSGNTELTGAADVIGNLLFPTHRVAWRSVAPDAVNTRDDWTSGIARTKCGCISYATGLAC